MDREGAGEDGDEAGPTDGRPDTVTVTVYSREHCHLCEEAIETLESAAAAVDVRVAITEVDVDDDPELRAEYGERVPYVLVEDRPAFKFRVDPDEAQRRLREAAD
jgi:glutaredoxin